VYNQQACGLSMSNAIHVTHSDSSLAPTLTWGSNSIGVDGIILTCPGLEYTFSGNEPGPWGLVTPGLWSNGSSGPSVTVQDTGRYYVTVNNACNMDTSNVIHLVYSPDPAPAILAYTDAFGLPADPYLCTADSVTVSVANAVDQFEQVYWLLPDFSQVFGPQSIVASQPGQYTVFRAGCTQVPATFTIYLDSLPPQDAPVVLPDQSLLSGCNQDTAYLNSVNPNVFWIWQDVNNAQQQDSALQLQVDWAITGYSLYNYNGCGIGVSDYIQVIGTPAPNVQYTEALDTLCLTANAFALTAGTPTGGTYSGPGVNANIFNPATAGIGQHTITYSYSDGNCTGFAQAVLVVDVCTGVGEVHDAGGITVSPNPNDGAFQVAIERIFKVGTLTLFDARGKRVGNTTRLAPGSNAITQTDLAPGVYQVRLEIDGKVEQRRVMITRE